MNRRLRLSILAMGLALSLAVPASPRSEAALVPVLAEVPACAYARVGSVSATVGTKEPAMGRVPRGVDYAEAFANLAREARDAGGNAVVLRRHAAAYRTQGTQRGKPRPTWISLQGMAITLEAVASCDLVAIDPAQYQKRSREAEKQDITTDNKAF